MKPGTSLEKDVRHVYSYLLNMRDEGVVVGNSVFMTGKSGVQHEIDVFYEFARVGIRHRVAIECKDWGRPVSKGQIQEFESKLRDIGNITGVVISRNGYQSGAEDFAKYHDILALRFEDLPAIHVRLAERIRDVLHVTIAGPEQPDGGLTTGGIACLQQFVAEWVETSRIIVDISLDSDDESPQLAVREGDAVLLLASRGMSKVWFEVIDLTKKYIGMVVAPAGHDRNDYFRALAHLLSTMAFLHDGLCQAGVLSVEANARSLRAGILGPAEDVA